jgi:diguanylate cyclase (GGDEF)-like protein
MMLEGEPVRRVTTELLYKRSLVAGCVMLGAGVLLIVATGAFSQSRAMALACVGLGAFLAFCAAHAIDVNAERRRSEQINLELMQAKAALNESQASLEERIRMRTAELELQAREKESYGLEVARLASRDSLTGLINRNTLADNLSSELERAKTLDRSIAVLFLDLDKFKEVNDLLGHHAGDRVLREVVKRMNAVAPAGSTLARWGGDEFVLVHRLDGEAQPATVIGDQLRRKISESVTIDQESVRVGASVGIAIYPDHGRTADELIRAADMAMYAAKQDGRDRVRTFDPSLADALSSRHILEQALREALERGSMRLMFQPIVSAHSWRCETLEALLRWEHPTLGTISPSVFIPLAERTGEIVSIGRWVLHEACMAAAGWQGDPAPGVSVNVSVAQVISGSLIDDVRAALAASGLDPHRLELEVTESLFAGDFERIAIPTLEALRALGLRISLDDFGTGFSSLGYLRTLPIDTIKIDQSFVQLMHGDTRSIIEAMQSIARAFDLTVVAEGVETADQAAELGAMGVHFLQGYYFARPLEAAFVPGSFTLDTDRAATTPEAQHAAVSLA